MLNMSAMREVMPEKAALMDDIFGYRISGLCVPTYNVTRNELSYKITHRNGGCGGDVDYQTERKVIIESCTRKSYVNMNWHCFNKGYEGYSGLYMAVSDMPIEILKAIKHEIGNVPYRKWLNEKKEKEKKEAEAKERKELTEKLTEKIEKCSNEQLKKILQSI